MGLVVSRQGRPLTVRCRAVCYNEAFYKEPHIYDPERFLKDGKLNSPHNGLEERVFGSGRRYARVPQYQGVPALATVLTLRHGFL